MLEWDHELSRWVIEHRIGLLDPLATGLSRVGSGAVVWLAIAVFLAFYRRRPSVLVVTALTATAAGIITFGLKVWIERGRPVLPALMERPESYAFPSGHTSSSFACATVLAAYAPKWRIQLFVLAALVGWSRIYVGAHYPLDVAAGALLGLVLGLAALAAVRALPRLATGRRRSRPAPPAG
jgi:undecaprenyl-diphosphatase